MATGKRDRKGHWWPILVVVLVLAGVPAAAVVYEAHRRGTTPWGLLARSASRAGARATGLEGVTDMSLPPRAKIDFLAPVPIGERWDGKTEHLPMVSNLLAVDLDQDGRLDVVACDAVQNRVVWLRQTGELEFTETPLAGEVKAPARASAVDFDGDGDLDLIVAALGVIFPCNDRIGSVHFLENRGPEGFVNHVLLSDVARVSDARAADLDGDGDLDVAVAQFGYDDGETRWLENLGGGKYASHLLQSLSGPIDVEPVDIDGDGDLDLVTIVSQEWEEVYAFLNEGNRTFRPKLLYGSANDDFGSSGILVTDFDGDGDPDVVWTNGDAFDYVPPRPRPWHGIQWLENRGGLEFRFRRIGDLPGIYGGLPVDVDHDGDRDLVSVSAFNFWDDPRAVSLAWFENDGFRFARRDIASIPTHQLSLAAGDFDGDGWTDFVTGGMHIYPPYDRVGRITLWRNRFGEIAPGGGR